MNQGTIEHKNYNCQGKFSSEDGLGCCTTMTPNGPAIKGGCVTWRSHPATYPGTLAGIKSRWQDRYGVLFANPGTSFIAFRRDRGITYQVDENFSRYTKLEKASGAVSRYKLSRSHKLSWYRELYYLQWCVSGFRLETDPGKRLRIPQKA